MMARPTDSPRQLNGCARVSSFAKSALAIIAVAFSLAFVDTARATHEPITVDGNLTDLADAITRNPGAANGGFAMLFPDDEREAEIYTPDCAFVNGFDVRNYYFFLDFKREDGSVGPPVSLYAGWEVFGIIGDVDGDGTADGYSPIDPQCALSEQDGIGSRESYSVEFDLNCDFQPEFKIEITNNTVEMRVPRTDLPDLVVNLSAQSAFEVSGNSLELRVDGIQQIVEGLVDDGLFEPGTDLCNAIVRMTADAEEDGLGEDRSLFRTLELPPSVAVTKTPDKQEICPGAEVVWTITVTNDGVCQLQTVTVNDVLDEGMTFVSSVPERKVDGDAQNSSWDFTDLGAGESLTITLTALVGSSCTGQLANGVTVDAVHQPPFGCAQPQRGAFAETDAFVNCVAPVCSITPEPSGPVCERASVTLCGPDGDLSYAWTLADGSTATTQCITVTASTTTAGTYSLTVTDNVSGCSSEPCTYELVVNQLPVCSITISDPGTSELCLGADAELCGPDGDYSYAWTRPDGSTETTQCISITGATSTDAGIYTLVVTDNATGCVSDPCTQEIVVNDPPVCSITGAPTNPVELGGSFTLCGPDGDYSYLWTLPDGSNVTTQCVEVTAAVEADFGTYTLVLTDNVTGCVSDPCEVTVVQCDPPICSIVASPEGPVCEGTDVEICGPEGNYTYLWTLPDGSTAETRCLTISNPTVANDNDVYTLVVTDVATGCVSEPCTYTLQVNPPPVCSITIGDPGSNELCLGGNTELCGPTGDYSYLWTRPDGSTETTQCVLITDASSTDAGIYTLVVTDNVTGCVSEPCTQEIVVNDPPVCSITGLPTDPVEIGGSFTLCGPDGDYSYLWTLPDGSNVTTQCVEVTAAVEADFGTYTLVLTDNVTGCVSDPCEVTVVQCDPPICSIVASPEGPVCEGTDVEICGPEGNYTYLWTLPDGSTAETRCLTISNPQVAENGGVYSLVVTDVATGCVSDPCTYALKVNPPPVCSITISDPGTSELCLGASAELCGPDGDYSYAWTRPDGSTETTQCISISSATSTDAGTYTLVVTDNVTGCVSDPCTQEIVVNDPPVCSISGVPTDPVELGGSFTLCGPDGDYSYLWTLPDGSNVTTQCVEVTSAVASDFGDYTLVLTDNATTCSSECSVTVVPCDPPVCEITSEPTGPVCAGTIVEICGPNGGSFTYLWTLPDGSTATTQCLTITDTQLANDDDVYTLVVTDVATGCQSDPCTYTLRVNEPPVCSITADPEGAVCVGTDIEICGPTGDYSYRWTLPDGSTETTQCLTISNPQASQNNDVYTLVVIDNATGCESDPCTYMLRVDDPPLCSITISDPGSSELCLGASAELCGPDGDYSYAWTRPDGSTETTQCIAISSATSTDAGTYTLVVTDNVTGCVSDPCTQEIVVNDPPVCSITGDPGAPINLGDSFELCGPDGDYSYAWTLPDGSTQITQCVSIASAVANDFGTYTLVLTDNVTGCVSDPCEVTIVQCDPPVCSITATPDGPVCAGTDVELCGPEGTNYTYLWTLPDGSTQTTRCISVSLAQSANSGTYTLTVTDGQGCTGDPCTYQLTVNNPPPCTIEGPKEVCLGETIELCGPEGGFTYDWLLPDGSTETTRCVEILGAQLISAVATGSADAFQDVSSNEAFGSIAGGNSTLGPGGAVSLEVTDISTGCVSPRCETFVVVHDPPACSITGAPQEPVEIGGSFELCGPEGDYSYAWTLPDGSTETGQCVTVASVTAAHAGTYELVVTDNATGCGSDPCTVDVTICTPPDCGIDGPTSLCVGETLELCAPEGDFTYMWTMPNGTILTTTNRCATFANPDAGTYSLKITDNASGCSSTCSHVLEVHERPQCSITGSDYVCVDEPLELCGPEGNFSYAWVLPDASTATTRCISPTVPLSGIYRLVVTDNDTGCSSDECTFLVKVRKRPPCAIAGPETVCEGERAQLCGPVGEYGYAWTLPSGETATTRCIMIDSASDSDAGEYSLIVTDLTTGCVSEPCRFTMSIGAAECSIVADPVGQDPNRSSLCIGDALTLCGPEGNFLYTWTMPGGRTSDQRCIVIDSAEPRDSGVYTLVVTNPSSSCESAPCHYEVLVSPPPPCVITANPRGTVNVGDRVELCGPDGPFTYKWTLPDGSMSTEQCLIFDPVENGDAGNYTLIVTDPTGCSSEPCSYLLEISDPICDLVLVKTADPEVIVPAPGRDCESIGKPRILTFRYTGESCSATRHGQDGSKVDCFDRGNQGGSVTVVYTGKDPGDFSVSPSGPINVGDEVTITAVGRDRFHSETEVEIRGGSGQVLQELRFHTSCSQPLAIGDQFGALLLLGINGVTGGSNEVTYTYEITNNGSPLVNAVLTDDKLGTIATGFDVETGETVSFTSTTTITSTTTNVATVTGNLIDADGRECSAKDKATVTVDVPPVTCEDGKPRSLVFEYTGDNCSATTNDQSGRAKCVDLGALGEPVQIVYLSGNAGDFTITPSGEVINIGDRFTISATGDKFPSNSEFEIRQGGRAVQKLEIHTSCSKPLNVGDQFGSLILREFHITLLTAATPAGSDVEVQLGSTATVSFDEVVSPGVTSLSVTTQPAQLPAGLVGVSDEALSITSTATYGGWVTITASYDESLVPSIESELKLLRFADGAWEEITAVVDVDGNKVMGRSPGLSSFVVAAPVTALGSNDPPLSGVGFGIRASYPNPTNGRTTIRYALTQSGLVQLTVHDVQGRQVASLESGNRSAGEHTVTWNGRATDGRKLAAGIYVIRLESAEGLKSSKLVVMD